MTNTPITHIIKDEHEHGALMAELMALVTLDPEPDTPEHDRIGLLALLIGDYEQRTIKFDAPDPIDAIKFRMEQQGLRQADVAVYFGSRSKVSEVLNRKRPLTLRMIRALHLGLGIPATSLIVGSAQPRNEIAHP